ncbi:MAG: DUF2971 domain-containing protein [Phycisphaerae bacterium]|nr:DUF2971 domain-containing protein [Phycisphaerae bacterium]
MSEKIEPTHLYHYTTAEGLKGIVEKQELWATHIFYLNDWKELWHGRGELSKALEENLPAIGDDNERRIGQEISGLLKSSPAPSINVFVCSFSGAQEGNDLSQWRAYCQDGGYSIGFPRDKLTVLTHESGFVLQRCEYGSRNSNRVVTGVIKGAKYLRDHGKHDASMKMATEVLAMFAATYKHPAFRAEDEWRVVHCFGIPSVEFRTRGSFLIPYVACKIADPSLWEDARIVVGPSSRETDELRVESVKMFLRSELAKHGLPTTCADNVRASGVPYRTGVGGGFAGRGE